MAGETVITVVGNLVDDVELRFTPNGAAVAKFRVASTPRTFYRDTNEWKDGESLFLTCSAWRNLAENVAESLTRGMRVIVQGRLKQRSYEDRDGVKRTVYELDVDEVGASLRNATAKVTKATRSGSNTGQPAGGWSGQQGSQGSGWNSTPPQGDDPWASTPATDASGGWAAQGSAQASGYSDEPPF